MRESCTGSRQSISRQHAEALDTFDDDDDDDDDDDEEEEEAPKEWERKKKKPE